MILQSERTDMDSRISVLMGVYNAEAKIMDAVLTIENQTEQEIEFVICDDGSTDRTFAILQDLKKRYPNIVLLRNRCNHGLAYSLNECLAASHGMFIARMDSDDRCVPERFQRQKEFLLEHPEYDLVGSEMIMVDEKGRKTYSRLLREPTEKTFPLAVPFAHPTVLMRRHVLERLGGYSVEKYTRRCEDLELWYRFFYNGMKGYNMPDYLYIKAQGIDDYRRRKVIHGCEMFGIHLRGLKMLNASFYRYPLALKPVISAMIPKRIMKAYHDLIFKKK